jgi:hypothetical protein
MELLLVLKQIQQHHQQAIKQMPEVHIENSKQLVVNLQLYSNNMREEQNLIKLTMCKECKQTEKTFWKTKSLPESINPKGTYPSRGELVKEATFGKPNVLK